ncbi:MAG: sigma-70 family RNA polymerase sigma factor [Cyanobacterium sp. T60_A2020_053]|nr:sigma-70 family RNA polymerase sigma factor [Cyanobacterium sp. T60_A2020_053]
MVSSISLSWCSLSIAIPRSRVKIDQLSNTDLIVRCQEGSQPDRIAFAELVNRYQSYVDKILYNLAPDWQEDRADLAQEVWIRVYKNIKRLQEPVKFKGWLSRITTNLFYDQLRKKKRHLPPLSMDASISANEDMKWDIPSDLPLPEDNLSTSEFYDLLHQAIASLPEAFRTTIILREIQGLSYEEIADITKVSLGTVKSRIARARNRLQILLKPYLETHN